MSFQFAQSQFRAEERSIVIIEPARHMQILFRSMLSASGLRGLRIYATVERAAESIISMPPDLVLVDWNNGPNGTDKFLNQFRDRKLYPICLTPIIVVMSEVRRRYFDKAIRLGAHGVLAKPLSTTKLFDYISWVLASKFPMELEGDRYVVPSILQRVDEDSTRNSKYTTESFAHAQHVAEINSIQSDVDRILNSAFY